VALSRSMYAVLICRPLCVAARTAATAVPELHLADVVRPYLAA
jgi:hypothetical protein